MEVATATVLLALLLLGSAGGILFQRLLKERHRGQETTEAVRQIVAILVTFSALVLGLLVTSVKADFDRHDNMYRQYGIALIRLDLRLRDYGPETVPVRAQLREYTAAVIANSWPNEPSPAGSYPRAFTALYPGSDESLEITSMLASIDRKLEQLDPTTLYQRHLYPVMHDSLRRVEDIRWQLVEGSNSELSGVFLGTLMSWLVIVFLMFGLIAPRNGLVYLALFLSAFSVASTIYVTLDLGTGFGGFIQISSQPLRAALLHMDRSPGS